MRVALISLDEGRKGTPRYKQHHPRKQRLAYVHAALVNVEPGNIANERPAIEIAGIRKSL
jgi:hypothetical protein